MRRVNGKSWPRIKPPGDACWRKEWPANRSRFISIDAHSNDPHGFPRLRFIHEIKYFYLKWTTTNNNSRIGFASQRFPLSLFFFYFFFFFLRYIVVRSWKMNCRSKGSLFKRESTKLEKKKKPPAGGENASKMLFLKSEREKKKLNYSCVSEFHHCVEELTSLNVCLLC